MVQIFSTSYVKEKFFILYNTRTHVYIIRIYNILEFLAPFAPQYKKAFIKPFNRGEARFLGHTTAHHLYHKGANYKKVNRKMEKS